jgi:hypothetical protein
MSRATRRNVSAARGITWAPKQKLRLTSHFGRERFLA